MAAVPVRSRSRAEGLYVETRRSCAYPVCVLEFSDLAFTGKVFIRHRTQMHSHSTRTVSDRMRGTSTLVSPRNGATAADPTGTAAESFGDVLATLDGSRHSIASDEDEPPWARKKKQSPVARNVSAIADGRTHNLPAATFSPQAAHGRTHNLPAATSSPQAAPMDDGPKPKVFERARNLPTPSALLSPRPFHDIKEIPTSPARVPSLPGSPTYLGGPLDTTVLKLPSQNFGLAVFDNGVIANVAPNGLVANAGFQVGGKLLSVNGSEFKSAKLLNELLGKVPDGASVRFTWEQRR
jgi:hypothetical protein